MFISLRVLNSMIVNLSLSRIQYIIYIWLMNDNDIHRTINAHNVRVLFYRINVLKFEKTIRTFITIAKLNIYKILKAADQIGPYKALRAIEL